MELEYGVELQDVMFETESGWLSKAGFARLGRGHEAVTAFMGKLGLLYLEVDCKTVTVAGVGSARDEALALLSSNDGKMAPQPPPRRPVVVCPSDSEEKSMSFKLYGRALGRLCGRREVVITEIKRLWPALKVVVSPGKSPVIHVSGPERGVVVAASIITCVKDAPRSIPSLNLKAVPRIIMGLPSRGGGRSRSAGRVDRPTYSVPSAAASHSAGEQSTVPVLDRWVMSEGPDSDEEPIHTKGQESHRKRTASGSPVGRTHRAGKRVAGHAPGRKQQKKEEEEEEEEGLIFF